MKKFVIIIIAVVLAAAAAAIGFASVPKDKLFERPLPENVIMAFDGSDREHAPYRGDLAIGVNRFEIEAETTAGSFHVTDGNDITLEKAPSFTDKLSFDAAEGASFCICEPDTAEGSATPFGHIKAENVNAKMILRSEGRAVGYALAAAWGNDGNDFTSRKLLKAVVLVDEEGALKPVSDSRVRKLLREAVEEYITGPALFGGAPGSKGDIAERSVDIERFRLYPTVNSNYPGDMVFIFDLPGYEIDAWTDKGSLCVYDDLEHREEYDSHIRFECENYHNLMLFEEKQDGGKKPYGHIGADNAVVRMIFRKNGEAVGYAVAALWHNIGPCCDCCSIVKAVEFIDANGAPASVSDERANMLIEDTVSRCIAEPKLFTASPISEGAILEGGKNR